MLTIGQLATYAGVTVRAVRHYHQIGLLPEPERDASGYRKYGAPAVVSLIKIRPLADAGVPTVASRFFAPEVPHDGRRRHGRHGIGATSVAGARRWCRRNGGRFP